MKRVSRPRRWAALAAAATLTATLGACGEDDGGSAADPAPSAESDLPEWAPVIETDGDLVTGLDFTDTPEPTDELLVETVTEGDGPPVEVGQTLTVEYFGSVYEGEEPFDESYSRDEPVQFPIGVGQLIAGWDETLPGVPVGSRVIMSIPSDKGYGDAGSPPAIPGGATLFFVIDVVDAA